MCTFGIFCGLSFTYILVTHTCNCSTFCTYTRSGSPHNVMHSSSYVRLWRGKRPGDKAVSYLPTYHPPNHYRYYAPLPISKAFQPSKNFLVITSLLWGILLLEVTEHSFIASIPPKDLWVLVTSWWDSWPVMNNFHIFIGPRTQFASFPLSSNLQ